MISKLRPTTKILIGASVVLGFAMPVFGADPKQDLGRVFLSPDERAALDTQREEYYLPADISLIEEMPIEVVEELKSDEDEIIGPALVVNGFVKRIGTSGTVWINGESTYDGDMANMNVDHLQTKIVGKKVRVAPINEQASVYLKPGQAFNPAKREIANSYELPAVSPFEENSP